MIKTHFNEYTNEKLKDLVFQFVKYSKFKASLEIQVWKCSEPVLKELIFSNEISQGWSYMKQKSMKAKEKQRESKKSKE